MWKIGGSVKLPWNMIRLYHVMTGYVMGRNYNILICFCFPLVCKATGLMLLCLHYSMRARRRLNNPTMHLSHIPQCTIQNRNVHISVLNGALWDMGQMHCGICEFDLCCGSWWYPLHHLDISSYDIDYRGYIQVLVIQHSRGTSSNFLCHLNVWKYLKIQR